MVYCRLSLHQNITGYTFYGIASRITWVSPITHTGCFWNHTSSSISGSPSPCPDSTTCQVRGVRVRFIVSYLRQFLLQPLGRHISCRAPNLKLYPITDPYKICLFVWVLWHINLCWLFNTKSIFIQINSFVSNNLV